MITSAGVELSDVGGSLSWGAFSSFIKNLDSNSAMWRSAHPEMADWSSSFRTNVILADIYDVLSQINANLCGGFSRHKPQRIKPYPRPWLNNNRVIGKGALPSNELEKWIEEKRKENRRS